MNLHAGHLHRFRAGNRGFTLIELIVSVALGVAVMAAVAILFINGSMSFAAVANYQDLDAKSTKALDTFSKEIRNATSLVSYVNGTSLVLTNGSARPGTLTTLAYNSTARTLVMTIKTNGIMQSVTTNLTGCESWSFALYTKAVTPNSADIILNTTSDAKMCKLITMTWKCSRTILGSKLNTESVQTAKVVLRNKIN